MTPTTDGGIKSLDTALVVLQQLNGILLGIPGLILLGKSLVDQLRSTGSTSVEAEAAITQWEATIDAAAAFNTEWRETHPRVTPAPDNG